MPRPLIDPSGLQRLLAAATPPILLDTGFDLADPPAGERTWRQGHLPGAQYLHLDRDLSGERTGRNGRHPLPSRDAFAARIGQLGIAPDMPVVVYDAQGSMFAARAWWMLRWLGHEPVAVLDGGRAAWVAAGGPLEQQPPAPTSPRPPYPPRASLVTTVDADAVAAELGRAPILDARATERFRGDVEPLDAQAGHIPGALNRPFKDNLLDDGRFRDAAALRADFLRLLGDAAPNDVVHQCGSGVTACHNLLAMERAGLGGSRLYPGSWSEWSADPDRPVARG